MKDDDASGIIESDPFLYGFSKPRSTDFLSSLLKILTASLASSEEEPTVALREEGLLEEGLLCF